MSNVEHAKPSAEAERDLLRKALAGIVGATTPEELRQLEVGMRLVPAPAADKAAMLAAIHALQAVPEVA